MSDGTCNRCGRPCRPNPNGSPNARLLRKATAGYCVNCATTQFLQVTEPIATILQARGPAILTDRRVHTQFAAVMAAGSSDAQPEEIDWDVVVSNWHLPFPKGKRGRQG